MPEIHLLKGIEIWLVVIAVLLYIMVMQLWAIAKRLRRHFPTDKEADTDWAIRDPMGHWEAHKNDKSKK
jgi:hypothetical protein